MDTWVFGVEGIKKGMSWWIVFVRPRWASLRYTWYQAGSSAILPTVLVHPGQDFSYKGDSNAYFLQPSSRFLHHYITCRIFLPTPVGRSSKRTVNRGKTNLSILCPEAKENL